METKVVSQEELEEMRQRAEENPLVRNRGVSDRVIANVQIYHQQSGDQPVAIDKWGSIYQCQVAEQLYERGKKRVGPEWQALVDKGCWIPAEDIGLVVLRNLEGENQDTNPTAEELVQLNKRVIEVSFDGIHPHLFVRPGWLQPFSPCQFESLSIRCLHGPAQYKLSVLPR